MNRTTPSLRAFLEEHAPLGPVPDVPELVAHQARDVFSLWQAWEAHTSSILSEVPFWAAVWPAARVLASALLAQAPALQLAGKRVLELGCGGGVAAIAAARAGASVVANDVDPVALEVTRFNAAANGVTLELDGADRSLTGELDADLILVADMFYEKDVSARLLERLRAAPGQVWIADGERPFGPREGRVVLERRVAVNAELEGAQGRTVVIRQLRP